MNNITVSISDERLAMLRAKVSIADDELNNETLVYIALELLADKPDFVLDEDSEYSL